MIKQQLAILARSLDLEVNPQHLKYGKDQGGQV